MSVAIDDFRGPLIVLVFVLVCFLVDDWLVARHYRTDTVTGTFLRGLRKRKDG